jgi:hypothetical protein
MVWDMEEEATVIFPGPLGLLSPLGLLGPLCHLVGHVGHLLSKSCRSF